MKCEMLIVFLSPAVCCCTSGRRPRIFPSFPLLFIPQLEGKCGGDALGSRWVDCLSVKLFFLKSADFESEYLNKSPMQ